MADHDRSAPSAPARELGAESRALDASERLIRAREARAYRARVEHAAGYTRAGGLSDLDASALATIDRFAPDTRAPITYERDAIHAASGDAHRARESHLAPEAPHYAGATVATGAPRSLGTLDAPIASGAASSEAIAAYQAARTLARDAAALDASTALDALASVGGDLDAARAWLASRAARVEATAAGADPSRVAPMGAEHASDALVSRGVALAAHGADGAAATAARVTRALRADGAPAARYADAPAYTGALTRTDRVRVRGTTRSAQPATGGPAPSACTIASMYESARHTAARDLDALLRSFARVSGPRRRGVRCQIGKILASFPPSENKDIAGICDSHGWRY